MAKKRKIKITSNGNVTSVTGDAVKSRDPAKGLLAFKTGVIKPKSERAKIRGDKYFRRELRSQLSDS